MRDMGTHDVFWMCVCGDPDYRLQEEIKKAKQLSDDLSSHQQQLKEKTALSDELQHSLTSLKEELVTTLQRFEQTKRHLEDQLIEEERAREEMQEQNLEFRKTNKKLVKELETMQRDPSKLFDGSHRGGTDASRHDGGGGTQHPSGVLPAELKGIMKKKLDDLQRHFEWSQMREHDLMGVLARKDAARAAAAATPTPARRMPSRMPSTTVITRIVPNAESEAARASGSDGGNRRGSGGNQKAVSKDANGGNESESTDENDTFDEEYLGGAALGIDDKNFEAYHQEVHRMLAEIEEEKVKNEKLEKVIVVREHGVSANLLCSFARF